MVTKRVLYLIKFYIYSQLPLDQIKQNILYTTFVISIYIVVLMDMWHKQSKLKFIIESCFLVINLAHTI